MEGLVQLKPRQAYGGCMGVVVQELPRLHGLPRSYEVYIECLGTVVRRECDLVQLSDADLSDPSFSYVTPGHWLASSRASAARKALMQAVRNNNHSQALLYAEQAAEAEIEMEADHDAHRRANARCGCKTAENGRRLATRRAGLRHDNVKGP